MTERQHNTFPLSPRVLHLRCWPTDHIIFISLSLSLSLSIYAYVCLLPYLFPA